MIDIDNVTIGELKKKIQSLLNPITANNSIYKDFIGKMCVLRTYSAGVHIGIVEQVAETTVLLSNSRRLWKWSDAFTLSEVAQNGVGDKSRIACIVPKLLLTQVIEIIETTLEAQKSYDKCNENG